MEKESMWGHSLIWFGAAVSIAEIMTGAMLAPLGFWRAVSVIFIGHLVGCALLFGAGWIGAKHNLCAMDSAQLAFGVRGGRFFAVLNLLQLVGWAAVMIAAGAQSACGMVTALPMWGWAVIIGILLMIWNALGIRHLNIINTAAVSGLFVLSLILGGIIFRGEGAVEPVSGGLTFGQGLELSIAMPLSYLPLIADYTCGARRPRLVGGVCAAVYFVISCWMYFLGLCAALYVGSADVAGIFVRAGLGIPALLIVVFSAVTSSFLDVYSSGMSVKSLFPRSLPKWTGATVCVLGVMLAIFSDTAAFEQFLYWIGSVFAPMIVVLIADVLFCPAGGAKGRCWGWKNLILWGMGFLLYRILLYTDFSCGSSIPVIIFTGMSCCVVHWYEGRKMAGQAEKRTER